MSEGFMLNGISNEHVNFHLHTIIYLCPHQCSPTLDLLLVVQVRVKRNEKSHFEICLVQEELHVKRNVALN
jgi:hypothetical protein